MGGTLSSFRKLLTGTMQTTLEDAFARIDEDNSGTISKAEFAKNTSADEAKINEMYAAIDKDASGDISKDEWVAYFGSLRKDGKTEAEIQTILDDMTGQGAAKRSKTEARKPFFAGNWKCNPTSLAAVNDLLAHFASPAAAAAMAKSDVGVFPPACYLSSVLAAKPAGLFVGAQSCHQKPNGAFTGEISAPMAKDIGATYVMIAHSERRQLAFETEEGFGAKTVAALGEGLNVVYCIGETLEEREAGRTLDVCKTQLKSLYKAAPDAALWGRIVVAYEPVWAIGTGKVASPEQAQEVHVGIRADLASCINSGVASATRIIYGGSVNAKNCADIAAQADIDGCLVGGAALKPEFAANIITAFN